MCVAIAGIKEDAKAEGKAEGRAEGEDAIVTLMQKLFASGRGGELERVSKDSEYRKKLMKEFGLSWGVPAAVGIGAWPQNGVKKK